MVCIKRRFLVEISKNILKKSKCSKTLLIINIKINIKIKMKFNIIMVNIMLFSNNNKDIYPKTFHNARVSHYFILKKSYMAMS